MTEELEDTERGRILSIVRDELRLSRVGEVTKVWTHSSADDKSNHEATVVIPPGQNPVRQHDRVPIAVPSSGVITVPKVGDLVLVTYRAGDGDRPVVTNVVYGDDDADRANLGSAGDVKVRRGDVEAEVAGDGSYARLAKTTTDGGTPDLVVEVDDAGTVKVGDPSGTLKAIARDGDAVTDSNGSQVGTIDATSTDVESS
jgi:hypothetical protein